MPFSSLTLQRLASAGWHEGRAVDPAPFVEPLRSAGYEVFPPVVDFFRRYGGLELVWTDHDGNPTATLPLHPTRAIRATRSFYEQEDYPAWVGSRLCPLFESPTWHDVFYMAEDGRVYAGNEDALGHVGVSGEDAIEAICAGREFVPVPERSET
jgi:hypothetical protein